ncbi:MAG TPA: AsmA-like C-terminal region-containing protein [Gemmatimonadaceae bacterium]
MTRTRKTALGIGGGIAALLVILLTLPFFFRDRVEALAKSEVNRSVNARVAWSGVSLGLLRDFPNVSVGLNDLTIVGVKPFDRDTLLSMRQARLVLDVGSVVRHLTSGGRIVVREIALRQPSVKLRVLADGTANWNIARHPSASAGDTSSTVGVTLRNLQISDATVTMDDQHAGLAASVVGLQESLRGDFARDKFVLATRTRADSVSVRFAGVPYLHRVALDLRADMDADLPAHRFTFRNDSLRLNNLVLAFAGSVTTGKPNTTLDVAFGAPSTAFRDILSLVPVIYTRDFARLQTAGSMSVAGRVRGAYGPAAFPSLAIQARVRNGSFRYPSLPLPARDIAMDLSIDNPGGHVDSTVVNLERLHAVIGGRPLDARLVMRTPVSDPDVDARVRGALDLADVARTIKLQGVTQLAGLVAADVAMRARLSDVNAHRYDRVNAGGSVQASRIALRSTAVPHPIAVDTAALRLTPRTAELTTLSARIGNSDVRATGSIDNLLGFALRDEDLRGSATVNSTRFDLDEWRSKDKTTQVIPVPPHVDFALAATADRVTYGALTLANVRGDLHVKDQRVTVNGLSMETLRGTMVATGYYDTAVPDRPTFDMGVRLASVDIPSAFTALTTVQKLAPVAKWAQGTVSGVVALRGTLGKDMTPVFPALTGKGSIETDKLVLQGAPVLEKLANALSLEQVRKPTLGAIRASFDVADGRVHVQPFVVKIGGIDMSVTGSNGIDQSLKYDLTMAVPRSALGAAATSAVSRLASQAGKAMAPLADNGVVQLGARVTGTMANPTVQANFAGVAASAQEAAQYVVRQAATAATDAARQKADSATDEAVRRGRAEADRMIADAQRQADTIRAQARALAEKTRLAANERADSLVARASSPVAKMAAQAAADRIRREGETQSQRIVREADARADAFVADAKQRANALVPAKS